VSSTISHNITFRGSVADGADGESIRRLAHPKSKLPEGLILLAEIDGDPVAAIGIADGRTVEDRDRATAAVRMRLRLERLYVRFVLTVWGM
jgi:hypothetical protein